MATKEQIDLMKGYLAEASPTEFFKTVDKNQAGMNSILRLLHESGKPLTAGRLSEAMGVSTARVAVLLRKMSAKGLITKETHALDGRVTVVRLTELGESIARQQKEKANKQMGAVIDRIGMDRMLEFVQISREIQLMMKETEIDL